MSHRRRCVPPLPYGPDALLGKSVFPGQQCHIRIQRGLLTRQLHHWPYAEDLLVQAQRLHRLMPVVRIVARHQRRHLGAREEARSGWPSRRDVPIHEQPDWQSVFSTSGPSPAELLMEQRTGESLHGPMG